MSDTRNTFASLDPWGWNDEWARKAQDAASRPGLLPGRVVRQVHHHYDVVLPASGRPITTEVSGAYSYRAAGPADYPTIGDWVLCGAGNRIEGLLPRQTAISRNSAGEETREQVIAANIDVVYLVFGLDGGRNLTVGMLERSLVVAWGSGARPVVVLNKTDCADEQQIDAARLMAESHASGASIHAVSAHRGDGLGELLAEARSGETVAMLGKSGVGKSALLNAFVTRGAAGPADSTGPAAGPARTGEQRRGDRQGRHTTSEKVLYLLPEGIIVADVPGLRELQLWGDGDELSIAFPEIAALAAHCRFSDCAHGGEPGCRVQEALATGELSVERYERYLEYQRELAYLERRRDQRAAAEEQKKWKRIAAERRRLKGRRGG